MQAERTNSEPRQAQLEAESAQLRAEKARLRALQEELTKQLQSLREQVQGLQRRLGLDSSNSGKPPSSDGPAKPPAAQRTRSQRRPVREVRGRAARAQGRDTEPDGHAGSDPGPAAVELCGLRGGGVGGRHRGRAPASAGVRFGTAAAAGGERTAGARLPVRGLWPRAAGRVPGGRQRSGAVGAARRRHGGVLAERAVPARGAAGGGVAGPVPGAGLRSDAGGDDPQGGPGLEEFHGAGARSAGECRRGEASGRDGLPDRRQDPVAARVRTPWLTFYRTSAKRGSLLEGLRGIRVHAHWASYCKLQAVLHGLCNAHHLRELQALAEIDGEAWAPADATAAEAGEAGAVDRSGAGYGAAAIPAGEDRAARRPVGAGGAGPAPGPASLADRATGSQEAPTGAYSGVAAEGPAGVGAAALSEG